MSLIQTTSLDSAAFQSLQWNNDSSDYFDSFRRLFGTTVRTTEKIEELRQKVELGDLNAMVALGDRLTRGKEAGRNYSQAFSLFTKAADRNSSDGMVYLCWMLLSAHENPALERATVEKFSQAALSTSNPGAMYALGLMTLYGRGGFAPNKEQCGEWLMKAADLGNTQSLVSCAIDLCDIRSELYEKLIMQICTQAIKAGNAAGYFYIAHMYQLRGLYTKAAEWLEKGAEAGDTTSMAELLQSYTYGWNQVEKNPERARELSLRLVNLGVDWQKCGILR